MRLPKSARTASNVRTMEKYCASAARHSSTWSPVEIKLMSAMRGWPVQRSTSISASYCRPYGRLPSTTYRMPAPATIGFRSSHSSEKARVGRMRGDELAHDGRACAGTAVVRLEPRERLARTLESGRVDELVQRLAVEPHRIRARLRRGAGVRRDRDRIVLGQRGHDAALALVRMPDDREARHAHAAAST